MKKCMEIFRLDSVLTLMEIIHRDQQRDEQRGANDGIQPVIKPEIIDTDGNDNSRPNTQPRTSNRPNVKRGRTTSKKEKVDNGISEPVIQLTRCDEPGAKKIGKIPKRKIGKIPKQRTSARLNTQ